MFDSSLYGRTGFFTYGTAPQNIVANGFQGNGLKTSQATGAQLNVPYTGFLASGGPFTIMSWFKHDTGLIGPYDAQGYGGIEKKDYRARLFWTGFGSYFEEGWGCKVLSGSSPEVRMSMSVAAGEWNNVACVYDGNVFALYVNGMLLASKTIGVISYGGSGGLVVGTSPAGQVWNGTIDEVRIYNRSLSQEEIFTLIPQSSQTMQLLETAKNADSFVDFLGFNLHDYPNFFTVVVPLIGNSGVRHVRNHLAAVGLNELQTKMDALLDYNVRFGLIADNRPDPNIYISAAQAQQHVKTLLQNLGAGAVDYVEGPNEPDNPNMFYPSPVPPNWMSAIQNYTKDLYTAFKADPVTQNVVLVGPSLTNFTWMTEIGDLTPWVDFANGHPYSWSSSSIAYPGFPVLDREIYAHTLPYPGKKLKVTETGGYHTGTEQGFVSEYVQAKYAVRRLFVVFNRSIVDKAYYYDFMDDGTNASNHYHNQGLVYINGTPKRSYNALKNAVELLKEPGAVFTPGQLNYNLTVASTYLHHALLQKSNGDFYLVLWLEGDSSDSDRVVSTRVDFNTPIVQAVVYSPTESTAPIASYSNPTQITLDVPDKILMLKITPA